MSDVSTIPSYAIDTWWPMVKPHLERFERETQRADAQTMRRQIKNNEKQLWCLHEAERIHGVVLTEVYDTARGSVCWIWAAAGTEDNPGDILRVYRHIEEWARSIGCVSIGIQGRRGWLKVLPGFKQTGVTLEKDLRDDRQYRRPDSTAH